MPEPVTVFVGGAYALVFCVYTIATVAIQGVEVYYGQRTVVQTTIISKQIRLHHMQSDAKLDNITAKLDNTTSKLDRILNGEHRQGVCPLARLGNTSEFWPPSMSKHGVPWKGEELGSSIASLHKKVNSGFGDMRSAVVEVRGFKNALMHNIDGIVGDVRHVLSEVLDNKLDLFHLTGDMNDLHMKLQQLDVKLLFKQELEPFDQMRSEMKNLSTDVMNVNRQVNQNTQLLKHMDTEKLLVILRHIQTIQGSLNSTVTTATNTHDFVTREVLRRDFFEEKFKELHQICSKPCQDKDALIEKLSKQLSAQQNITAHARNCSSHSSYSAPKSDVNRNFYFMSACTACIVACTLKNIWAFCKRGLRRRKQAEACTAVVVRRCTRAAPPLPDPNSQNARPTQPRPMSALEASHALFYMKVWKREHERETMFKHLLFKFRFRWIVKSWHLVAAMENFDNHVQHTEQLQNAVAENDSISAVNDVLCDTVASSMRKLKRVDDMSERCRQLLNTFENAATALLGQYEEEQLNEALLSMRDFNANLQHIKDVYLRFENNVNVTIPQVFERVINTQAAQTTKTLDVQTNTELSTSEQETQTRHNNSIVRAPPPQDAVPLVNFSGEQMQEELQLVVYKPPVEEEVLRFDEEAQHSRMDCWWIAVVLRFMLALLMCVCMDCLFVTGAASLRPEDTEEDTESFPHYTEPFSY